jgi:hypothetical protein
MWTAQQIVSMLITGLREAESAFAVEQSPLGLDALSETELHPILAAGIAASGLTALREVPYPGAYRRGPLPRERERCDLVVLPEGSAGLLDPLSLMRAAEVRAATLFAEVTEPLPAGTAPEDAFWLEVKVVAQYAYVEDVPGPNGAYTSGLTRGPGLDIAKLAREPMIDAGGVAIVLFGAEAAGIRHDLGAAFSAMLDRDLPVSSPAIEVMEIADRAGNAAVGVCVVPLRAARD